MSPLRSCTVDESLALAVRGKDATLGDLHYAEGVRESTHLAVLDDPASGEGGDSGGGWTWLAQERTSPVIGVNVALARFDDQARIRGASLLTPEAVDWIWSVLDPAGACTLGSLVPCTFREAEPAGGDVCGDHHCTGGESYATCPTDCQPSLSDRDGDGLPDVRDLCPDLDGRTLPADRIVDGNHIDLDGDSLGDDCDHGCALTCSPDPDLDGVPADCDICPEDFDPEQLDTDGDGLGDACDPCPSTPPAEDEPADGDRDRDGLGDACDSCPDVPNPDQANCNLDAEFGAGIASPDPSDALPGIGDACDPVPCGETELGTTARGEADTRVVASSRIRVDGRSTETQEARTGFRFCVCEEADVDDPATRLLCQNPLGANCVLDARTQYDNGLRGEPEGDMSWRFTTVELPRPTPVFDRLNAELGAEYAYDPASPAFVPSLEADWDLRSDGRRWASVFEDVPRDTTLLLWTVPGVLWTHTPGPAEASAIFEDSVRSLAHHYWSGVVSRSEAPRPRPGCFSFVAPLMPSRGCPFCAGAFPEAYLSIPLGPLPCGGSIWRPSLMLPELAIPLLDLFDPRDPAPFEALLARDDLRWVAASEPLLEATHSLERPTGGLRLAALEADGSPLLRVRDTVQGLTFDGQQAPCPQCDPIPVASLAAGARRAPPAPSGEVPVLSASREMLFLLQGDAAARRGAVRVLGLPADGAVVSRGARTAPIGRVLAATYERHRDALYLLDEVARDHADHRHHRRGHRTDIRLVRLDVGGLLAGAAEVEVLGEWPRLAPGTVFAMGADPSGALWVIASPRHVPAHWVLRIDPHAEGLSVRWAWRPGELAPIPTTANREGFSYVIVDWRGRQEVQGVRADDLRPVHGRALESCF